MLAAVKRRVPDRVVFWGRRVLGRGHLHPLIDVARVQRLRAAPLEQLTDPAALEELLWELGIIDEAPEVFPVALRPRLGHGLLHWQYPPQFSRYLVHLSRYPIESYLEIGIQHGGTFVLTVEYLERFRRLRGAWGIDIVPVRSMRPYIRKLNPQAHFVRMDSASPAMGDLVNRLAPLDLVLIDGDHSRAACLRDFESVHGRANLIAFHDIVDAPSPGVGEVWRLVREQHADTYDFVEFTEQYEEVTAARGATFLGIGLAVRKDFRPTAR